MEKNIGTVDKIIRIILAVVCAYFGFVMNGIWMYVFYILSAVLLITAITGFCLPYKWLKISTVKKSK